MKAGDIVAGKYRVEGYIAKGAMGAVYRVTRLDNGVPVALKVLHRHQASDPIAVERFQREMGFAQAVDHPGICRVLDAGRLADNKLFMVMELVEGESLAEWIGRNGGNWNNGMWVMLSLLEPLAVAHREGIVHRDLKPENVMLSWDSQGRGNIKLLDFGVARRLQVNDGVTHTGTALGTPHYMAPEQFKDAKTAGAPADVWSLGVIMYEMITGETPFTGPFGPYLLIQVCSDPHTPILERAPNLDVRVGRLIDRCLAKEPAHRPADAGALWRELGAIAGIIVPPSSSAVHERLKHQGGDKTVALEMTAILQAIPVAVGAPTGGVGPSHGRAAPASAHAYPMLNSGLPASSHDAQHGSAAGGYGPPAPSNPTEVLPQYTGAGAGYAHSPAHGGSAAVGTFGDAREPSNLGLWIGLGIGGIVFLMLAGVLLAFLFLGKG